MPGNRIETAEFSGRVLMVGCGSIGQAMLPLLRRHVHLPDDGLAVLEASEQGRALAAANHAKFVHCHLKPSTYQRELRRRLKSGDLLLNLSVDVSSLDLVEWCSSHGVLYVDTSIEPWPGVFDNPMLTMRERTNYRTREDMLKLGRRLKPGSPTAVVDHGANPGLVSHFVKQALLDLASGMNRNIESPTDAAGWAALARRSEERRVGKECGYQCRSRWSPYH